MKSINVIWKAGHMEKNSNKVQLCQDTFQPMKSHIMKSN